VASGLFDIGLADRGFDKDQFLKGAQAAYEMILTAFAAGDRETLKPLLSDDVFTASIPSSPAARPISRRLA